MNKKFLYILLIGCIGFCQSVLAQSGAVEMLRGKVVSDSGEELISATVLEMDKAGRVVGNALTDMNGEFSLKLYSAQNKLQVRYSGFETRDVAIGTQRSFNIVLKELNVLKEVVIRVEKTSTDGTLTIPERENPFAMQKLSTADLEGMQITSIDDALQGQIAGLDIVGSGDLGKGASMRIRGTSSINGNVEPLIVVNGIPREDIALEGQDISTFNEEQFADLLSVNPDDILDIQVLKDAGSTAIWGSRGANGVLQIQTKKGVTGPTRIKYSYKLAIAKQPKGLEMLNGDDYTMMMKQALFNAYHDNSSSDAKNKLALPELNYDPEFSEYVYFNNNTDWREAVIQTAFTHDHTLNISGGGDKAKFRVSGGYVTQDGTIIGQDLDRFTTRMDLDYNVSSRITFSSEFMFTYTDNNQSYEGILANAYKKMPNLAIYNKDKETGANKDTYYNILEARRNQLSSQGGLKNPVAVANLATNNAKSYNIQPTLRIRYDLLDPEKNKLEYSAYVSFQMRNDKTHKYLPKEVSANSWSSDGLNNSSHSDNENFGILTENAITWIPKIENTDHSFNAYAAIRTGSSTSNGQSVVSYGAPSSVITNPTAGGFLQSIGSSIGQSRSFSMVGRIHYSYKGKYVVGLTINRDSSTRFGKDNKFGNFPGVSLRWNISDESFMDFSKDWLSMLSIRPTWGISGNKPGAEYLHYSKYKPSGSYAGQAGVIPENMRLSNLKWERTEGWNLGFDIEFFDGTYDFDINLYHNTTRDLLHANSPLPSSTGYTTLAYKNAGTLTNKGWELNFNANRFLKFGDWSFDVKFNIANQINKIKKLDQDILDSYNKDLEYGRGSVDYLPRIEPGKSYGSIFGYKYKGVYAYSAKNYKLGSAPVAKDTNGNVMLDAQGNPVPMYYNFYGFKNVARYQFQAGDAIYEDVNKDGTIDELDIVYLGNSNPTFNGGVGFTVRWKQLQAIFFANFRYGNKVVNQARLNAEKMDGFDNQSIAVNWRWRKEGDEMPIPRALYNYGYNSLPSDRYVEDGSFFRLKYIQIRYNVPSASLKQYGIRTLDFGATINNIFTLTKYQGVDPEVGYGGYGVSKDGGITPREKNVQFNVSIGF
ncbi:TonB-linked SusC/RagA family outer membrane protein [Dysgonomonadaceae bacterium PH5-43]|nr:TonB-linked SusC/RagA family outer membrane protein [Dysgonomonadaceae bacterium PH5-43]